MKLYDMETKFITEIFSDLFFVSNPPFNINEMIEFFKI